jgi:hypothetical protein
MSAPGKHKRFFKNARKTIFSTARRDRERMYIEVSGGVVQHVWGASGVEAVVIDWDNLEADPEGTFKQFDETTRRMFKHVYRKEYEKYFGGGGE